MIVQTEDAAEKRAGAVASGCECCRWWRCLDMATSESCLGRVDYHHVLSRAGMGCQPETQQVRLPSTWGDLCGSFALDDVMD